MFYKQLSFFGYGYYTFSEGVCALVEDEEEAIEDAEGQTYLDFERTPSLF